MLLVHPGLVLFGTETRKRSMYHTFWGQILTEIPLGSYVSMWTLRENLKEPKRLYIRPKPILFMQTGNPIRLMQILKSPTESYGSLCCTEVQTCSPLSSCHIWTTWPGMLRLSLQNESSDLIINEPVSCKSRMTDRILTRYDEALCKARCRIVSCVGTTDLRV